MKPGNENHTLTTVTCRPLALCYQRECEQTLLNYIRAEARTLVSGDAHWEIIDVKENRKK